MQGGIVNDNIVFPVLDLIRQEVKDSTGLGFTGVPTIELYRDHPLDDKIVTSATLSYDSGLVEEITLGRGSDDESTYPKGVTSGHYDYEYCKYWRLTSVIISYYRSGEISVGGYNIEINYDNRGLMKSTTVATI